MYFRLHCIYTTRIGLLSMLQLFDANKNTLFMGTQNANQMHLGHGKTMVRFCCRMTISFQVLHWMQKKPSYNTEEQKIIDEQTFSTT